MNFDNLPAFQPDLNQLKKDLAEFCKEHSIKKFEPEDIIELLEDGEEVSWVVDQLNQENAELPGERLTTILNAIHSVVAPSKKDEETEEEIFADEEETIETAEQIPPLDMSQLDLSQMGDQLEAMTGMKLPPGVNMNQLQKLMEGPQGKLMTDFAAWCQEQEIDINTISDQNKIQELNAQYMQTPREAFQGKTPEEASEGDPSMLGMKKVETFRRSEPRIGRNDPCPCGSGKKYKKCCGKGK